VARDGSLSGQRALADLQSTEKGAVDGMKIDERGNIYTTGPGGVWVISKTGQHLGTIRRRNSGELRLGRRGLSHAVSDRSEIGVSRPCRVRGKSDLSDYSEIM